MHEIIVCDPASNSLAPGQNPACDLSGPTTDNYKGFAWQASWGESYRPHRRLGASKQLQSLKGAVVKDPGANDWPCS